MQDNKGENKQGGLSWSTPAAYQPPVQNQAPAPKPFVAPKPQSNITKYASMVALGIIAGVIIAWSWSAVRAPKESSAPADTNLGVDASTAPILASSFNLTIASPQAAGNSVAVAKADVSAPTWIVIYENNAGQPGNALGAALFFPGNQGGAVELLRGTRAGKSYFATLQVDNGDRKFSLKDDQFRSANGKPQWIPFEVK